MDTSGYSHDESTENAVSKEYDRVQDLEFPMTSDRGPIEVRVGFWKDKIAVTIVTADHNVPAHLLSFIEVLFSILSCPMYLP